MKESHVYRAERLAERSNTSQQKPADAWVPPMAQSISCEGPLQRVGVQILFLSGLKIIL